MTNLKMKKLRILIIILLCAIALPAAAQSSCDKLFNSGVKLQQTMTVASQNKAISYFQKAKVCYDSKAKKDLCDQHIKSCKNIIAQLNKKSKEDASKPSSKDATTPTKTQPASKKTEIRDVKLSLDPSYLKFKAKGGEFKKAKVDCNYPDWSIKEKPEWVSCSKNEGEIVVEANKNSTKAERSGNIIIECGDKSVTLIIIQEKPKKFGIL